MNFYAMNPTTGDKVITLKDKETGITVTLNDDESGKAEMLKYIKDNS